MTVIIDRRLNPAGKNHINKQRFLERAKSNIKETVKKSITDKTIKDLAGGAPGNKVKIKSKDLSEPYFQHDYETGNHKRVLPGNKQFSEGDVLPKPKKSGGGQGQGEGGSDNDFFEEFQFTLTREEFLNYLFEDLELPDFVKESIKQADVSKSTREGFTKSGSPANLNVGQTFKKSIGRRLALRRPTDEEVADAYRAFDEALEKNLPVAQSDELYEYWQSLVRRQKVIPFIDENDLKYNLWTQKPNPSSQAVMFCLMDVSGSMGEKEKDIAKRFFLLLYLFLERKYKTIQIRFIRHTTTAEDVDENTFFYDTKSGGTAISSGLKLIDDIINREYRVDDWNIYIAQCTDGDNFDSDNLRCREILEKSLLKKLQYYAYLQVDSYIRSFYFESFSAWPMYEELAKTHQKVQCKKVTDQSEVWTIFQELFSK